MAELADLVAAVARAGLPPARTWALVATGARDGAHLAAHARPVGRARPAVRNRPAQVGRRPTRRQLPFGRSARRGPAPPAPPLLALAVALDVCDRAGAPTSDVLAGLARSLRAQETARQDRDVALAAPRATASVMGLLPVAGTALGLLLGVNPAAVLLFTPVGRLCLVMGLALWMLGRWWMQRLVGAAAAVSS